MSGGCERRLAAGINDHITKPVRIHELSAALGK